MNPELETFTAENIASLEYVRERKNPKPTDRLYLMLSDLREALENLPDYNPSRILDFGSGGSPYRDLFPNIDYQRADFAHSDDLDYIIEPGRKLDAPDASFDLILSTQVLEHVPDYHFYLAESRRLLKPGGRMILSSHGFYPEHGFPFDFHRWTINGISNDLVKIGFEVQKKWKLTTGLRALSFLVLNQGREWKQFRWYPLGFPSWLSYRLFHLFLPQFHRWADRVWQSNRIVDGDDRNHRLYIGFLVTAQKPESTPVDETL